ncbi:hypothetical protein Acr_25g0000900 [Actinidia rufa]|uniref:Retroviral polymerase SH3-like domain-containing protein n=1 Tax=Actinidia rufa TaxID=165716 RepID=A0A7J0GY36_9ERIC|nr:hypothetical protein Acr_25g0000900 [Actinidia rufa]
MWVTHLSFGLLSSFDGAQSQILGAKELPSLSEIFNRLCQDTLPSVGPSPTDWFALVASVGSPRPSGPCRPSDFGCRSNRHGSDYPYDSHGFGRGDRDSGELAGVVALVLDFALIVTRIIILLTISTDEYQCLLTAQSSPFPVTATQAQTNISHVGHPSRVTLTDGCTSHVTSSGTDSLCSSFSVSFVLHDLQTGEKIGGGSERNGLYYFGANIPTSVALRLSIDPCQLHCQLGHPSLQNLKVSKSYWSDAILTTYYLANRMPSSILGGQVPHQVLFLDRPLYNLPLRVFGCTCYVHTLDPGHDKLDSRAIKYVFLGYSRTQKGVWSLGEAIADLCSTGKNASCSFPVPPSFASLGDSSAQPVSSTSSVPINPNNLHIALHKGKRYCTSHHIAQFVSCNHFSPSLSAFTIYVTAASILKSLSEPLFVPYWRQAMIDEMMALHENGKWELVSIPPGQSLVGWHGVFTVKYLSDGIVERYKARPVAKVYTQTYVVDYAETFSPVAKIGEKGQVCRLCKTLYGHKQSPIAWFEKFSDAVQQFAPRLTHMEAALRIVTNLNAHPSRGLFYGVVIHIESNLVFHEKIKHNEVVCHIVHGRVENGGITTPFVSISAQLADVFTKPLFKPR